MNFRDVQALLVNLEYASVLFTSRKELHLEQDICSIRALARRQSFVVFHLGRMQAHNVLYALREILDILHSCELSPRHAADFVKEDNSFNDRVPVNGKVC